MLSLKSLACLTVLTISQLPVLLAAPEPQSYLKQATISETAGTIRIVANNPRPLTQVLDSLRQKYGWTVSYEDPQFISKLDLVETVDSTNHALKISLPGGGLFSVEFPSAAAEEEKTLQLVVDAYNRSNNPGRFELRKGELRNFSIVGAQARDSHDQISREPVLLDLPITLAAEQRTASETVRLICQELAARSRLAVTVGVSPRRILDQTPVTVGGAPKPARDLLLQTLTSTHRNFYWHLLFDANSKNYFLELHLSQTP